MSTIPKTRADLIDMVQINFQKLENELDRIDSGMANLECEKDLTVKQLLAVRVWWTKSVVTWVQAGMKGKVPVTPAKGYSWKETPRLNKDIAEAANTKSFETIINQLRREYKKLLKTIDSLEDKGLLEVGVYEWAGNKWPVSRWLSVNTARQYETARKLIRKANLSKKPNSVYF